MSLFHSGTDALTFNAASFYYDDDQTNNNFAECEFNSTLQLDDLEWTVVDGHSLDEVARHGLAHP